MIGLNLSELEAFIEELNELLRTKKDNFIRISPSTTVDSFLVQDEPTKETLSETESKVYVLLNHYFRLLTLTVSNLSIAYEIWLKGILQVLLQEVGLTLENWDRICTFGDHNQTLLDRIDTEWTGFLEEIKKGNINNEAWELIQKGKKRSNELMKRKLNRKSRNS